MSVVSLKKVDSYDDDLLYQAVCGHFEALDIHIPRDSSVLIKPNLLAPRNPDTAVTTHPTLVAAVVRRLREMGISRIVIADSPSGTYNAAAMKISYSASGLTRPETADLLNHDFSFKAVPCSVSSLVHSFNIITPVIDADYIINMPKLKTHAMTTVSVGVKNLFGVIPGLQKPDMHCRYPDTLKFTEMLCELAMTVKPGLTILDAIDSMEGNGPGGGTVRHTGMTMASSDVFTLDVAAVRFMGYDPETVPHLIAAKNRGFLPDDTDLTGDELVPCSPEFLRPDTIKRVNFGDFLPGKLGDLCTAAINSFLRSFPKVDRKKCVGCGKCAESCPQHIITISDKKASMPKKGCISCFCCQEVCPAHAINAKRLLNL